MTKNYKINFSAKTVTVSKAFMTKATTDMESVEFKQMQQFISMGFEVLENKISRKNKHCPTYKQITAYISRVIDSDNYLKEFESVRIASLKEANPYQYVMNWFEETFPNHKAIPVMDENNKIINFADVG